MAKQEKVKGHCDYCERKFTLRHVISPARVVREKVVIGVRKHEYDKRYHIEGLIVCGSCYSRYKHNGNFERHYRTGMPPEERKEKQRIWSRNYERDKCARRRERTKYLLSLTPEQLLAIVRGEK